MLHPSTVRGLHRRTQEKSVRRGTLPTRRVFTNEPHIWRMDFFSRNKTIIFVLSCIGCWFSLPLPIDGFLFRLHRPKGLPSAIIPRLSLSSKLLPENSSSSRIASAATAPNRQNMSSDQCSNIQPAKEGIAFEALPWNLNHPEEHCYVHLTTDKAWTTEHYDPATDTGALFSAVRQYASTPLPLAPACCSLNYGTTVWEGLKCFRLADGSARAFRPDRNHARFARGAEQMALPPPSRALFLRGVQHVLQRNAHLIPPPGEGTKLYVRPMLLGSGEQVSGRRGLSRRCCDLSRCDRTSKAVASIYTAGLVSFFRIQPALLRLPNGEYSCQIDSPCRGRHIMDKEMTQWEPLKACMQSNLQ